MTWGIFFNNQTVKQASLLPHGQISKIVRYIFIQDRDLPIIFTDVPQPHYAVGINDGENAPFQLDYDNLGNIQVKLVVNDGGALQYTVTSGSLSETRTL